MNSNYYCIIMAGGVGSRFWPMSREACPKQFIDILGLGKTFIQLTFDRMAQIVPRENILIVTSERYHDLVREQIPDIAEENILLEPYKRNTAPCIAYATYKLFSKNPDATVVVAPADHLIAQEQHFCDTISIALDEASKCNNLYTLGIHPTRPDTNFGYIQFSKSAGKTIGCHEAYQVKTFTEKPGEEMAKVFLETGEFVWNSGIFIWNLRAIKAELETCLPEVAGLFKSGTYYSAQEPDFIHRTYAECPAISIDYGVMENTKRAWVFLADFGWSDVGTWNSVYERSPNKDDSGNIIKCGVSMIDATEGTIIETDKKDKLVVVRGLKDMMVIDTSDVLLVCPRGDKSIKNVITDLSMKDNAKDYL